MCSIGNKKEGILPSYLCLLLIKLKLIKLKLIKLK